MKFKSLTCDSLLSLAWHSCETYTLLDFWLLHWLLHLTDLYWFLLMSLTSMVEHPGLSLQTCFLPGLLTY